MYLHTFEHIKIWAKNYQPIFLNPILKEYISPYFSASIPNDKVVLSDTVAKWNKFPIIGHGFGPGNCKLEYFLTKFFSFLSIFVYVYIFLPYLEVRWNCLPRK